MRKRLLFFVAALVVFILVGCSPEPEWDYYCRVCRRGSNDIPSWQTETTEDICSECHEFVEECDVCHEAFILTELRPMALLRIRNGITDYIGISACQNCYAEADYYVDNWDE